MTLVTIKALMRLPIIELLWKIAQKTPLKSPLLESFANEVRYMPWATQRIAAPKPLTQAAIKKNTRIKL